MNLLSYKKIYFILSWHMLMIIKSTTHKKSRLTFQVIFVNSGLITKIT